MYNLKCEENEKLISSFNSEFNYWSFLRYIVKYGKCSGITITEKKKDDFFNIFEYLKPNEYQLFKQNIKEPTKKKKTLLKNFIQELNTLG